MNPDDATEIRERTLRALARNRLPGYNFAGHFLDLQCRRYDPGGVVFDLPAGPHNTDEQGVVDPAALSFFADMVLAAAARTYVDPTQRTATLLLRYDFTGVPARGVLTAEARSDGFSSWAALPHAMAAGTVTAAGAEVLRMSGTWVSPPTPEGRTLAPLPWETSEPLAYPVVGRRDFDAMEKRVVQVVERALQSAGPEGLLRHLWWPQVRATADGATSRMPLGLHLGNRVGHVQGGLTMHIALATAVAAAPEHPLLTGASAWYISPGQGKALTTRSVRLQTGRNVAVVRTEVYAPGRKLVLEVISNHAVAAPV